MRAAVWFDMFGPYHVARMHALGLRADVLAIEVSSRSSTYAWAASRGSFSFKRATLFEADDSSAISTAELSFRLCRALSRFSPKVAFIPGWSARAPLIALRHCLRLGVPTVVMSESTEHDQRRTLVTETVKRRVVRKFSSALVGGTPHAAYLRTLGFPHSLIHLGYDVVDNDYFQIGAAAAREDAAETRRKYMLPDRYFLASSRLVGIKNLPVLLTAFQEFLRRSKGSDARLVVLGDGSERLALERLAANLNIGARLLMPGFIQYADLPAYYGLATAFVHVSRTEPWGLVVNEALASRLPVVVSRNCGCSTDLVIDRENGFLVDHDDPSAIASALSLLDSDPETRRVMGVNGERIISAWNCDRFARGAMAASASALASGARDYDLECSLLMRALI